MKLIKSLLEYYLNHPIHFIITIILFILAYFTNKIYVKFRGYMGEFWVRKELSKLSNKDYIILNDIMIESNEQTYQIDHIVISRFGIFVVEMKNYYGYIYGSDYKKMWLQKVGKSKRNFYNPIYQNYGHVKALSKVLNLPEESFISIICFSNQAILKIKSKSTVIQLDDINKTIKSYNKVINKENINLIREKIINNNITNKLIRKKHVKIIKDNFYK